MMRYIMEFESPTYAKVKAAEATLQALRKALRLEEIAFAGGLVALGWAELHQETKRSYGEEYPGHWVLISPEAEKVLPGLTDRWAEEGYLFDPEEEGVPEDFYCILD
jgi:hypothetical protein